jgi:hypothetical protein
VLRSTGSLTRPRARSRKRERVQKGPADVAPKTLQQAVAAVKWGLRLHRTQLSTRLPPGGPPDLDSGRRRLPISSEAAQARRGPTFPHASSSGFGLRPNGAPLTRIAEAT